MTLDEILKQEFCEEVCEREDSCGGECRNNALTLIKARIREVMPKEKNKNFDEEPYCKTCRLSETFCQCDGWNQYKSEMDKAVEEV